MTKHFETINPATEASLDSYPLLTNDAMNSAVERCHGAFLEWRTVAAEERAKIIASIGKSLQRYREQLAHMMSTEMGKVLSQSFDEVDLCAGICEYTAKVGPELLADERREHASGKYGLVTKAPLGVIYGIQPWNFPAYQVARYSIANLMAGNGVLLKHAENVTGSGQLMARIYRDAGLPDHLFQAIVIDHDQSDTLIEHKLVRGVTLTGSDGAGRHVAQKAAACLKKTVMELGSNDAYIVLEDADLENAVQQCVLGRTFNAGQTCVAAKRFVVVDAIYDRFRDAFIVAMENITYGDPLGPDVDMGPMARRDLRETLHDQVKASVDAGARVACGGQPVEGTGFYYPATVLENVTPGQPAYEDELFGPVASLIRAKDEGDAMRIANGSRYGLGGAIFSSDEERAVRLASQHFDTGMVYVNGFGVATPTLPFGGVKDSGWGREHGGSGLLEFVNEKAIHVLG